MKKRGILVEKIEKYVPRRYIPEIIRMKDVKDYMLLGQMILCTEELDRITEQ